ncbi:MAG: calponin homology domain-containing protein [Olpidium bornovanus]|uniref:Calponin homology domain-containing protein n=1 Tax=Olpidium bornovanus TaxID=278681 RepID=A0A8H8A169_9FUNG|nr:MAG: calponin homology domain-containing protein [Olpidium bornovanus]
MSESRTELLAWLNDLLQTDYTKVEQCGTGERSRAPRKTLRPVRLRVQKKTNVPYAFPASSFIAGDVPMSKVKFDAKHQYEYVQNFKVLQSAFTAHKVDKIVPVERLIQCKFQDNLEFLQWIKKYWDTYYQGGAYDAVARRKSKHTAAPGAAQALTPKAKRAAGSAGSIKKASSNLSGAFGRYKTYQCRTLNVNGRTAVSTGHSGSSVQRPEIQSLRSCFADSGSPSDGQGCCRGVGG